MKMNVSFTDKTLTPAVIATLAQAGWDGVVDGDERALKAREVA